MSAPIFMDGVIFAIFSSEGNMPICMHVLKILANTDERNSADIFINLMGIFRIPVDFFSFNCIILRKTSFIVHGSQKKDFVEDEMMVVSLVFGIFEAILRPMLVKKLFNSLPISLSFVTNSLFSVNSFSMVGLCLLFLC